MLRQEKGLAPGPGGDACDWAWRIDFGKLLRKLSRDRKIHAAILVGSRPPANDSVWNAAAAEGFRVTVHDRDAQNREKAVDTELVAQATEIICEAPAPPMVLVIASGDRDFIPLVRVAKRRQWRVEMAAFSSAFNPHGEMASSVDCVRALDEHVDDIALTSGA